MASRARVHMVCSLSTPSSQFWFHTKANQLQSGRTSCWPYGTAALDAPAPTKGTVHLSYRMRVVKSICRSRPPTTLLLILEPCVPNAERVRSRNCKSPLFHWIGSAKFEFKRFVTTIVFHPLQPPASTSWMARRRRAKKAHQNQNRCIRFIRRLTNQTKAVRLADVGGQR